MKIVQYGIYMARVLVGHLTPYGSKYFLINDALGIKMVQRERNTMVARPSETRIYSDSAYGGGIKRMAK